MPNYGTRIISLDQVTTVDDADQILIHIKSGDRYLARRMTLEDFAESMNLIVNAFLPLDGSSEMSGNIIDSNNTHTIGSQEKPWLRGYFDELNLNDKLITDFIYQIIGDGSEFEIASTSAIVDFVNSQTLILSANILNDFITQFVDLADVDAPSGFIGLSGAFPIVNATEDKLELVRPLEMWTNVPTSNSSEGIRGQRAYDGTYMYECVLTNTWIKYAVVSDF